MRPWMLPIALALALTPLLVVQPVRVQGESMYPTLRPGQRVWVLRRWAAGEPRRYEIWWMEGPEGPAFKRILGLPGEILEQRHGDLWLAGQRLDEPYVRFAERGDAGPWICGSGYLVLGDHRPESRDGRTWGPLPRSAFKGRLLGVHSVP